MRRRLRQVELVALPRVMPRSAAQRFREGRASEDAHSARFTGALAAVRQPLPQNESQ